YADCAGATGSIPDPGDPALRQYTQSYRYDAVGNLLEMKHQQGLGGAVAWRRGYAYESGNNQLVSTSAPGDHPATHTDRYPYNERGAMTAMPHLPALVRDPQDQIRRADLDLAGSVAWYAYDAAGQRVRKRVDKGGVQEERIYVGGYEVWRKRTASGVQEERETVHVMDDQRRIALVETLTVTNGAAIGNPTPRQRYQLDDHLGTATLEVDELGALISYEEYHPFGTTSWWASNGSTDVSQKRYRYTGKEKDEETGLAYHGARYYAAWLGRWERPDPIGLKGGINRFSYVSCNPVMNLDTTGNVEVRADMKGTALAPRVADPMEAMHPVTSGSEPVDTLGPQLRATESAVAQNIHNRDVAADPVAAYTNAALMGAIGKDASPLATPGERAVQGTANVLVGESVEHVTDSLGESTAQQSALPFLVAVGEEAAAAYAGGKLGEFMAGAGRGAAKWAGGKALELVGMSADEAAVAARRLLPGGVGKYLLGEATEAAESIGEKAVSRAMTPADFGFAAKEVSQLNATFTLNEGVATVRVDMIEGQISNPLAAIPALKKLATESGAKTLRIEGTLANEELQSLLRRRYGAVEEGVNDVITFQLGERGGG
ncbi:MAG: RHS repeat-associated core domain-containing protein, partial [Myxococcota bacterium]